MIIDGYLKIPIEEEKLNKLLKLECLCNNPEYYTRKRMGFSLKDIPRKISIRKKIGNEFWYPRFLAEKYIKNFKEHLKVEYGTNIDFKTKITLRDFQIPVVEETLKFMKGHLGGCIQALTGTGKSVMSLDVMSKLKKTTCIVVHKKFLANQWVEYIKEFLLIPENRIGIINGNKIDIEDKWIVVCLVQSLLAKSTSQPESFYRQFGMVIFDEVHHFSARTFQKVIGKFPCRYRLGISATPCRKDGMEDVFFKHIGEICFTSEVRQITPNVYIIKGNTLIASERPFKNYLGKVQLWKVEEFLCNSEIRNRKIIENIISAVKAERRVLILSGRRKHLELLMGTLLIELKQKHVHTTLGFYMGGMKEEELKKSEKCMIIFGTFSMSSEGLNLPLVDTLILATPKSSIEQSIGRILRKVDGKKTPIVIDFADNIGICKAMLKKRKDLYKELKYNIKKEYIL
jgi:superfamily II DNA or RNA helicase